MDVLMLDVANVVRQSSNERFDTVFFFDRDRLSVVETQKRIPGAIGFPGSFTDVVLLYDPDEESVVDSVDPLASPESAGDISETRELQMRQSTRREFIRCFPFDVINLDLEEFAFKPNDPLPGKVINAIRKLLEWQRRPLAVSGDHQSGLDGFSLMFTTQVGPPNLSPEYRSMLRDCLERNVREHDTLRELLLRRVSVNDISVLQDEYPELFFKLATPKMLVATINEEDWYIDPTSGITAYEIQRLSMSGTYTMLHLVMDIRRQDPPKERRAPGAMSEESGRAYGEAVQSVFANAPKEVNEGLIEGVRGELQGNLDAILARRQMYCPDE